MKSKKNNLIPMQALLLSLFGIQVSQAGEIVVDSIQDQAQPGLTTLREAIATANDGNDVVITFDETLFSSPQTIVLQNGEILLTSPMTIDGPGADLLTIDAEHNSRLFFIDDDTSSDQQVAINGITLTRGNGVSPLDNRAGGCVFSFEKLSLNQMIITRCQASGAGGGVATQNGVLNINESTISFNSAGNKGGGVSANNSALFISGSTINNNNTTNPNTAGGGVFLTSNSNADISNSTIANNQSLSARAAGIFIVNASSLLMNNATVVNNSGAGVGIKDNETVIISNSIIAENGLNDCDIANTNSNSANLNNLDSDSSCDVRATNHTTAANVLLVPLANHGGSTMTLIPNIGSAAIDAADDSTCESIDQRGTERPQDGDQDGTPSCDIGAVEGAIDEFLFSNGFE